MDSFVKIALAGACGLLLCGCVHATRTSEVWHFDLGPPAAATLRAATTAGQRGEVLQIPRIDVPAWLAGTAMSYRLRYTGGNELATYAHSDWAAPPATLLEPIVQGAIAASGAWRAVLGPGNPAAAAASLHLRLQDFSQAFAQPDASTGVLDATATLVDARDGRVVAQRHFHVEVAASTPDARGGAMALAEASREFATRVLQWLQHAASHH